MMRNMTGHGEIAIFRMTPASSCTGHTSAMACSMNSSCLSAASMLSALPGAYELVTRPTDGLGDQDKQTASARHCRKMQEANCECGCIESAFR